MRQDTMPLTFHTKSVLLAEPHGFCAGVVRAINIVERALAIYGAPVYVHHEIVHNRYVVQDLQSKGAVFISELSDAPDDSLLIFSAHGVSKKIREQSSARCLRVIDATCPLVAKVQRELLRHYLDGVQAII